MHRGLFLKSRILNSKLFVDQTACCYMFVEGNPAPTFKFYKVKKKNYLEHQHNFLNAILFKGLYFRGCKSLLCIICVEYRTLPVLYISLGKIARGEMRGFSHK